MQVSNSVESSEDLPANSGLAKKRGRAGSSGNNSPPRNAKTLKKDSQETVRKVLCKEIENLKKGDITVWGSFMDSLETQWAMQGQQKT